MKTKSLILSVLIFIFNCSLSARAYEINAFETTYNCKNELLPADKIISLEKTLLAFSEVCSCRDYYGVSHTCYFSPYTDPFTTCFAKCFYEAGN